MRIPPRARARSGSLNHRASAVVVALAVCSFAIAACRGCTSKDGVTDGAAGSAPDAAVDRKPDLVAEARPDATEVEAPQPDVASEPDAASERPGDSGCALSDWQPWTGWSDQCPIYVPAPGCQLPAPIEWEPCPPPVPQDIVCKRMKNTWGGTASPFPRFWRDPSSGAALILFTREEHPSDTGSAVRLVAEADGPLRMAQFYADYHSAQCAYSEEDLSDSRYLLNPHTGSALQNRGAIGGTIDSATPSVLQRVNEPSNWRISSQWVAQLTLGAVKAWSWDGNTSTMVYEAAKDPNGLQPHDPLPRNSDIFVNVGDLTLCGEMSWNPQDGLRPLLRRYSDPTWAAGNFGTDGKDMVWTQSQGANACDNDGPNPEVWTAPYTTDPAVLKTTARRVRTDVRGMSAYPYAVGFGYAARWDTFGSPMANSAFIVRLSDGRSWVLIGFPKAGTLDWTQPLGFTDQELFISAGVPDTTIVRIRLDSLGPGTPPD